MYLSSFLKELKETLAQVVKVVTSRAYRRQAFRDPLYANSFYLMLHTAVNSGLGFVFWLIVARFSSPEDVGLGSALVSAATLLAFVGTLGLHTGIVRFRPASNRGASALINSSFILSALAAAVAAVIFLVGLPVWSPALTFILENPTFMSAFVIFVVGFTLLYLLQGAFIAFRRAGFVLVIGSIQSSLRIILVIPLAILSGTFAIFASWGIGLVVVLIIGLLFLLPRVLPEYHPLPSLKRRVTNEMLHFSIANYVGDALWNVPIYLLPIIVLNLLGSQSSAYFYISWAIATLLIAIPMAISTSLFAEGSYRGDSLAYNVRRSLKMALILLLPAVAVILLVGDKILLLFGREYAEHGTKLLWLLAISALPLSTNLIYVGIARVRKRRRDIILIFATVAIGTLALSYLLLPHLGIFGVGVSWLASHSLVALALLPKFRTTLKEEVAVP
ncbi:lipopolysaccharide biosynthesis protein [Chloroflexota bacterium]